MAALAGPGAEAQAPQAPRPQYLPFAEFATDDSATQVTAKQAYNDAVERYNKALYDYHVTLGQHDQLVEAGNRAGDAGRAGEGAGRCGPPPGEAPDPSPRRHGPGRAVDQARRKASQAGVTLTR